MYECIYIYTIYISLISISLGSATGPLWIDRFVDRGGGRLREGGGGGGGGIEEEEEEEKEG